MYVVISEPTDAPSSVTSAARRSAWWRVGLRPVVDGQPGQREDARVHERGGEIAENRRTCAADDFGRKQAGIGERHHHQHHEQPQTDPERGQRRGRPAPTQGDGAHHRQNGQHAGRRAEQAIAFGVEAEALQRRLEQAGRQEQQQRLEDSLRYGAHLRFGAQVEHHRRPPAWPELRRPAPAARAPTSLFPTLCLE